MIANRNILILFAIVFLGISACSNADKAPEPPSLPIDPAIIAPAEQMGKAYAAMAASVSPAVVGVFSEKTGMYSPREIPFPFGDELFREFFGGQMPNLKKYEQFHEYKIPQRGMGSGMLIDHEGHILTNFHVVRDVDEIKVQFADEKTFKAKIVGKDERTDVAVIQMQGSGFEKYPVVVFGNSDDVRVGDVVLAIGAPFGLAQTVTHGIISATGRADVGIADYEDFLQTDTSINPGNSGGPLVNTHGEVIGMNSAIATNVGQFSGVGFSIPSNMIKAMLPTIIKGQVISRGELGVTIQNLSDDLAAHFGLQDTKGVLVSQVIPDSAADKAGLKAEDVITHYDNKPVNDVRTLRNLVAGTSPGSKIKMDIVRDQKKQTMTVIIKQQSGRLAEVQSEHTDKEKTLNRLGLSVETLTRESASRFNAKTAPGVVIVEVIDGSPASFAGLQVGDVIIQSNRKKVENIDEFMKTLNEKNMDAYLFLVDRSGSNIFVSIRVN